MKMPLPSTSDPSTSLHCSLLWVLSKFHTTKLRNCWFKVYM